MNMNWRQYALSGDTVDLISQEVQEYCDRLGNDSKEKQRIRLTVEEILLRLLEQGEDGMPIEVGIGPRFGKEMLILRYGGPSLDPTGLDADYWNRRIMSSLGTSPVWIYPGHMNRVSLALPKRKRHGAAFGILAALAAAAVFGLLGRLAPEALREGVDAVLLRPISDGFLGLLRTFAGLMIVFSIASEIVGMGDISTLRRTGKRFFSNIIISCTLASVMALVLSIPTIHPMISWTSQASFTQVGKISEMLFAILPTP